MQMGWTRPNTLTDQTFADRCGLQATDDVLRYQANPTAKEIELARHSRSPVEPRARMSLANPDRDPPMREREICVWS